MVIILMQLASVVQIPLFACFYHLKPESFKRLTTDGKEPILDFSKSFENFKKLILCKVWEEKEGFQDGYPRKLTDYSEEGLINVERGEGKDEKNSLEFEREELSV